MSYSSAKSIVVGVTGGGGSATGLVVNVQDYGAKADAQTLTDITMPNGNVVTSASYVFSAADIGKVVVIRGATRVESPAISPLIGHIVSVNGHSATLNVNTTGGLGNVTASSYPRMDFGTDNVWPFVLACYAIPGPGQRDHLGIPNSFAPAGVMNPVQPGDGGTVFIPAGKYMLVSESLGSFWWFETNNIHILGAGMGSTILYCNSNPVATNFPNHYSGSFANHGLFQNVTYSDFTIWDLNYYFGGGNSLWIYGTDNLLVERVELVNGKGNGCLAIQGQPTAGTHRVRVRDCWVHGNTADGYDGSGGMAYGIQGDGINIGEVTDLHFLYNRIEGPGRHGFEGGGQCYNQEFIGNTVDMKNNGLSGINPTGGSQTVAIGNHILNVPTYYGIDFTTDVGPTFAAQIVTVKGNQIINCSGQAAFRFQNTSNDVAMNHIDFISVVGNIVTRGTNVFTDGVLIGAGASSAYAPLMLIADNLFDVTGWGFSAVNGYPTQAGKYVIMRNNFCAGGISDQFGGNMIVEGNSSLHSTDTQGNRYGGFGNALLNNANVAAGATYTSTPGMLGCQLDDTVEIFRGPDTDVGLIIWGKVTTADTTGSGGVVTIKAYNPTAGSLYLGNNTARFMLHRTVKLP